MTFVPNPKARADLKAGALYAINGEGGWIYYGHVLGDKSMAFYRRRDREAALPDDIVREQVMAVILIALPSIGRALRSGAWCKLGYQPLPPAAAIRSMVQWPVGTLTVTIHSSNGTFYDTRVENPAIQDLEIIAAWDALYHLPARLTADFGVEPAAPHVGGPIWRERRIKEANARQFPEAPWHALPPDWVSTRSG